jgi:hypothetical protein
VELKPIDPSHPYLPTKSRIPGEVEHFFQPVEVEWPLYSISVHKLEDGFSVSVQIKRSMDSWWEACNYFNPIPFELAPFLKELL